jgi:regulator of sirC expression with transglutaminase-like and TPR domain
MTPSPEVCRRLSAFGALGDNEFGLSETALVLAGAERPGIDATVYERHLEKLTDDVAAYAGKDADNKVDGLQMRVEALQQIIAKRYGYGGSDDAYEDFECANLMRVIDRRDGFDGGRVLEPFDLRGLYKAVSGPQVEITPEHTQPMTNRAIILRSRRNAKVLHLRSDDLEQALDVVDTLLLMAPKEPALWREAGILNARLDRVKEAVAALEEFLNHAGVDASRYRTSILLQELRGRLN